MTAVEAPLARQRLVEHLSESGVLGEEWRPAF